MLLERQPIGNKVVQGIVDEGREWVLGFPVCAWTTPSGVPKRRSKKQDLGEQPFHA